MSISHELDTALDTQDIAVEKKKAIPLSQAIKLLF